MLIVSVPDDFATDVIEMLRTKDVPFDAYMSHKPRQPMLPFAEATSHVPIKDVQGSVPQTKVGAKTDKATTPTPKRKATKAKRAVKAKPGLKTRKGRKAKRKVKAVNVVMAPKPIEPHWPKDEPRIGPKWGNYLKMRNAWRHAAYRWSSDQQNAAKATKK